MTKIIKKKIIPSPIIYYNEPVEGFSEFCIFLEIRDNYFYEEENIYTVSRFTEILKIAHQNNNEYYLVTTKNWSDENTTGIIVYLDRVKKETTSFEIGEISTTPLFAKKINYNYPHYNSYSYFDENGEEIDLYSPENYISKLQDYFENTTQMDINIHFLKDDINEALANNKESEPTENSFLYLEQEWLLLNNHRLQYTLQKENETIVDIRIPDEVVNVVKNHFKAINDGNIELFKSTLTMEDPSDIYSEPWTMNTFEIFEKSGINIKEIQIFTNQSLEIEDNSEEYYILDGEHVLKVVIYMKGVGKEKTYFLTISKQTGQWGICSYIAEENL